MDYSTPGFPVLQYLSVCSNSSPLGCWCYLIISSFVASISSCLQSFPASGSFPMSQLFASGGQRIGASASVLPMSIQGWFPLRLTSLISWQSKGLSKVFSSPTVWNHHFFVWNTQTFLSKVTSLLLNTFYVLYQSLEIQMNKHILKKWKFFLFVILNYKRIRKKNILLEFSACHSFKFLFL